MEPCHKHKLLDGIVVGGLRQDASQKLGLATLASILFSCLLP